MPSLVSMFWKVLDNVTKLNKLETGLLERQRYSIHYLQAEQLYLETKEKMKKKIRVNKYRQELILKSLDKR